MSKDTLAWSDPDDVKCSICREVFDSDPSVQDKSMLPVRSRCDHCICHGCLSSQHSILVAARPNVRHVPCPICSEPQSFDAKNPQICRRTCRIVAHYNALSRKEQQEQLHQKIPSWIKQEEDDKLVIVLQDSENDDDDEKETTEFHGKEVAAATTNKKRQRDESASSNNQKAPRSNPPAKMTSSNNTATRTVNDSSNVRHNPTGKSPQLKAAPSGTIITLAKLLTEKNMAPSRDYDTSGNWIGKGPRNERELLRFYAEGMRVITHKKKWEWDSNDPELTKIRNILDKYKGGTRAPSKWRTKGSGAASSVWSDYQL